MMPALKEAEEFALEVAAFPGRRLADFLALTKPRVVSMVVITTVLGYYLGAAAGAFDALRLVLTMVGTALAAGGTMALNQYGERRLDARMLRTRLRPLPDGRLEPTAALVFGAALVAVGLALLWFAVDPLPALVTAVTSASYLFLYTPLKTRSSLCTLIGAFPGALPPLTGWAAASGHLDPTAWIVFAVMFFWQIPHSLAIAQLYREDYARAGFRLLPVIEPDGASTARHIVGNALALLAVGLLPTLVGLTGPLYFWIALLLGLGMLEASMRLARTRAAADARRLMIASLLYLPCLLALMAADKLPLH